MAVRLDRLTPGERQGTAELVWSVMSTAIGGYGVPMCSLSDNGRVYCLARYDIDGEAAFEINLRALGCQVITSTPYHPQTCGKIERFWPTLKKWLRAHGPYPTLSALDTTLHAFAEYYNTQRPHRALHGRTPANVYAATTKARPAARPLPGLSSVRQVHSTAAGIVSAGRYRINVGQRWGGLPMTVIKDSDHIAIYTGNQLVRALDADPTQIYQPAEPSTQTQPHNRPPRSNGPNWQKTTTRRLTSKR